MLVKCDFCSERVSKRELPLHEKHCVNRRRLMKHGKLPKPETVETVTLKNKNKSKAK